MESFIYNFPKDEEIAVSDSPYMLDESLPRYTMFRKVVADYYSDVPVIKPHTGNTFYIKNMKIEILGTLEDMYPKSIVDYGMNVSTTLSGRQTVIFDMLRANVHFDLGKIFSTSLFSGVPNSVYADCIWNGSNVYTSTLQRNKRIIDRAIVKLVNDLGGDIEE